MAKLGLDFGTSNTAAAMWDQGGPRIIPMEDGALTLPTAVFVDFDRRSYVYGTKAARAMREGSEGRFMRALKSVLGTSLANEPRPLLNERITLVDVIARFLAEIRERAERTTGLTFDSALSGRPVRFHSASEVKNAQALVDLTEAYKRAGFKSVDFLPEPEAAALAAQGQGRMLIVDIGGGTSDFTLCDRKGDKTDVLFSHGIRLGGTDFDKALSLDKAMPLLGYGAGIGAVFGDKKHTAPRALFQDLASWEKIPFVYNAKLLREVQQWVRLADHPVLFERLATTLESHLGHDIAYGVEAAKISANDNAVGQINLGVVERGLRVELKRDVMNVCLGGFADQIRAEALETLKLAECAPNTVDHVVFVGGSSLLGAVRSAIGAALPDAGQIDTKVFTAVADGLAIAAR